MIWSPRGPARTCEPGEFGLARSVRVKREAGKGKGYVKPRPTAGNLAGWEERRKQFKEVLRSAAAAPGISLVPPHRQTVGNSSRSRPTDSVFPTSPGPSPGKQVEDFCNKPGYSGFGNKRGRYDIPGEQFSGAKLKYTNIIYPDAIRRSILGTTTRNKEIDQPIRARQQIKEALDYPPEPRSL